MAARAGRPWASRALRALGVAGVLLSLLALRVVAASAEELRQARHLEDGGHLAEAIAHHRRAARWYAPGNPYAEEALARLETIGLRAEDAGDVDLALAAHRSIRGAVLGARSFFTPHAARLARADARIAALMGALPPPPLDAARSVEERTALHLSLLQHTPRPSVPWALLALAGLAGWIGAAFAFVTRALDEDDQLVPTEARLWGAVWIVSFGLFLLGLALA